LLSLKRVYIALWHFPHTRAILLWAPLLSFSNAASIWLILIAAGIFAGSFLWMEYARRRDGPSQRGWDIRLNFVIAALMVFSHPTIFLFERGGTDIIIFVLLSVGGFFLSRSRWVLFGWMTAWAALVKIYPAFVAIPVFLAGVGMLICGWRVGERGSALRKAGRSLVIGMTAGGILMCLPYFKMQWHYYTHVLFTVYQLLIPQTLSHSWTFFYGTFGWAIFAVLWLLATGCFSVSLAASVAGPDFRRGALRRAMLAYGYLLTLSVFVPTIGFDYSLILVFPLLCLLAGEREGTAFWITGLGTAFLAAGCFLPRWLNPVFDPPALPGSIFLALETVGLVLLGAALVFRSGEDAGRLRDFIRGGNPA